MNISYLDLDFFGFLTTLYITSGGKEESRTSFWFLTLKKDPLDSETDSSFSKIAVISFW